MYARQVLTRGGAEFAIGLIWFAFSVIGWAEGYSGLGSLFMDLLALGALLLAVFRPVVGLVAASAVVVLALFFDPMGIGLCHYIALCALVPAIRRGLFGVSLAGSAVVGGTIVVVMVRRAGGMEGLPGALFSAFALLGLAWLIGSAFRLIVRAERDRVSRLYAESHVRMATDIHDFVSRNLTSVLARVETDEEFAATHPELRRDVVARLRQSGIALDGVTGALRNAQESRAMPAERAADVLAAEVGGLRAAGFRVEAAVEPADALDGLREDLDFVVSRVLAEALHNVLKHGDPSEPCTIDVRGRGDEVSITVRNKASRRSRRPGSQSLGLLSMARHASLTEGSAASGPVGVHHWECAASFPLQRGIGRANDENPSSDL